MYFNIWLLKLEIPQQASMKKLNKTFSLSSNFDWCFEKKEKILNVPFPQINELSN